MILICRCSNAAVVNYAHENYNMQTTYCEHLSKMTIRYGSENLSEPRMCPCCVISYTRVASLYRRLVIFYLKCAAYKSTYLLTYLYPYFCPAAVLAGHLTRSDYFHRHAMISHLWLSLIKDAANISCDIEIVAKYIACATR